MTDSLLNIQKGIAEGNEHSLAELYRLLSKRLHHFARIITRSQEMAEEIVDNVFVKLWSNRHRIHEVENITVYLYVAVKNRSLNAISQKASELIKAPFDHLDIETGPVVTDPYNQLVTSEMMKRMQQAVENLPARCKMIFKLVREDGLKHREVAEILNISINTVDVQMAIAIKKICTELQLDKSGRNRFSVAAQAKQS
jgi:RNA polymerase sigma-70 factor, Bacteroides expansion family 1